MLKINSLDDQYFSQIVDKAIKSIPKYAPQWTDFNPHDPGITLIELFAYLKEIQQYHLDQISDKNREMFLKLLGITCKKVTPAQVVAHISCSEDKIHFPKGYKFLADDTVFENEKSFELEDNRIISLLCNKDNANLNLHNEKAKIYPFTPNCKKGNTFTIELNGKPKNENTIDIYFEIFSAYKVKRNPVNENFLPIVNLNWQIKSENTFENLEVIKDSTYGFIQSGLVTLKLPANVNAQNLNTQLIQITLQDGEYDIPPVISGIYPNSVELIQKESLSYYEVFDVACEYKVEHYLLAKKLYEVYLIKNNLWYQTNSFDVNFISDYQAVFTLKDNLPINDFEKVAIVCFDDLVISNREIALANGFPNQSYMLEKADAIAKNFEIIIEKSAGIYEKWEQTNDLNSVLSTDKKYFFNELNNTINFGDSNYGMVPKGQIKIISMACSKGFDGNITENRLTEFATNLKALITNSNEAYGGENAENINEAFVRYQKSKKEVSRAITFDDYEKIVSQTPGLMIESYKAINAENILNNDGSMEENSVNLVVKPFSKNKFAVLNSKYMDNIYKHFSDKCLIGTKLNVLSPQYVGIVIYLQVVTKPYYRDAYSIIKNALENMFLSEKAKFGESVLYSDVYGGIDTLDCVTHINSLTIEGYGKNIRRNLSGDLIIPANSLTYLEKVEIIMFSEE